MKEEAPVATANGTAGPWLISNVRQNFYATTNYPYSDRILSLVYIGIRRRLGLRKLRERRCSRLGREFANARWTARRREDHRGRRERKGLFAGARGMLRNSGMRSLSGSARAGVP